MKVMDTESALWNKHLCFRRRFPIRNLMLRTVISFVFLVPDTFEYSQDLHAKKKTPLMRLAISLENLSFREKRWLRSMGVTAFWGFSRGSERLNDLIMLDMCRSVLPSAERRGSGRSLS